MEYGKLVSVTGLSGLYELLSSKADGALVKNVADGTTKYVSSRVHQFSHLESIEIYTNGENANLLDVFKAMRDAGKAMPDSKDTKALKAYFSEVYPDMDFDRVYTSDMKKMVRWYEQLDQAKIELKASKAEEPGEEVPEEEVAAETETEVKAEPKAKKKKKTEDTQDKEA